MGQYRQWIYHRELDRTLRAQLTELENELFQLRKRATHEQPIEVPALMENAIVKFLATYQAEADPQTYTPSDMEGKTSPPSESISSALQAWSSISTNDIPFTEEMSVPQTPVPHHELTLLPDDMTMFIEEHSSTLPRIATPWWLRNILAGSKGTGPINQQNIGTNRLIQRWVARWGQQIEPTDAQTPYASEDVERELQ